MSRHSLQDLDITIPLNDRSYRNESKNWRYEAGEKDDTNINSDNIDDSGQERQMDQNKTKIRFSNITDERYFKGDKPVSEEVRNLKKTGDI